MSLYRRLAQLRPMMFFSALSDVIGSEWKPGTDGGIAVNGCFFARVDINGIIGSVRFDGAFPQRIEVEGLRLKMPLDGMLSVRPFDAKGPNVYRTLDAYSSDAGAGNNLLVYVSRADHTVHSFEIIRPGLSYPGKATRLGTTMVVVAETNYADSAEMLRDWVESNASESLGDKCDLYARWLSVTATPEDWDQAAANWNWDNGLVPLFWIIRQPTCEKATAFHLFYACDPGQYIDEVIDNAPVSSLKHETFGLFVEIRARLLADFYTRATIGFDAARAFQERFGNEPKDDRIFRLVPKSLRQPVSGDTVLDHNMVFTNGYPDAIWK